LPIVADGLSRLEYRGYDSAGIAILGQRGLEVQKCEGRLSRLIDRIDPHWPGQVGMGHTRWATHGAPSDANSHPHQDCHGELALIHNGIIENYLDIKARLLDQGHVFSSETDTEVAAHLIEQYLAEAGAGSGNGGVSTTSDPLLQLASAVRRAASELRGAYALGVMWRGAPEGLVAMRADSPLILGVGDGESFLASDIPALLPHTQRMVIMENGDLAVLRPSGIEITGADGQPKPVRETVLDLQPEVAEMNGYRHFMEKEIFEQPEAVTAALRGRLRPDPARRDGTLLPEIDTAALAGGGLRHVHLVACGTAYHAGLVGRRLLEQLAGIHAFCDVASEFRYRNPLIGPEDLFIAISQSGETSDTLGALREAQRRGARTLGVVNVVGSSVAREAAQVLYTRAGPEIAVASTKAYTTQMAVLTLFALEAARLAGRLTTAELTSALAQVGRLPAQVAIALETSPAIEELSESVAQHRDAFFIGRGLDYAVCLEGQLKLKEISYLHAEAYPAGELKHGTLALIAPGVPVIAVATQASLLEKTISNIREVLARGGDVTVLAREDLVDLVRPHAHRVVPVPATAEWLQPILAAIPLQLLAYHVARIRGCDVDKPRNLAKSVTVE
jgi:glucosamine--fructose-6-phosphate aminotransferase (isomerizing)